MKLSNLQDQLNHFQSLLKLIYLKWQIKLKNKMKKDLNIQNNNYQSNINDNNHLNSFHRIKIL